MNDDTEDLKNIQEFIQNMPNNGGNSASSLIDPNFYGGVEEEKQKECIVKEATRLEVRTINTKIHSFDKPVFITYPGYKVYSLIGKTPVLRIPEVSTQDTEMHIINDKELVYSVPSIPEKDHGPLSTRPYFHSSSEDGVFVICGKFFGTRNLDALASILLKINPYKILVQKYTSDKNNKGAHWVPEYNKQVTKLEHNINKFLRNNDR